jgi:mono/diheme cytochrome c family protein
MRRHLHALVGTVLVTLLASPDLLAQKGEALFTDNCAPCHNIGEAGGVGPDLRDISSRRDRVWLAKFILDPDGVTKSGDPYATQLAKKYDGAVMPPPQGLSREDVLAILDSVDTRSARLGGASLPLAAAEPVFTPEDVSRGRVLYIGSVRLANGGPSCLMCHEAGLGSGLGGGMLGPDLAAAPGRLNGARGMTAWLSAPPTPVMRAMFGRAPLTADEVRALTAFFVDPARRDAPHRAGTPRFLAFGAAGTIGAFFVIGLAWRARFRPVRRALIAVTAAQSPAPATHRHGFRSGGLR